MEMDYTDASSHLDVQASGGYPGKRGNDSELGLLSNFSMAVSSTDADDNYRCRDNGDDLWTDVCGWNCIKVKHCRFASWLFQVSPPRWNHMLIGVVNAS